MNLAKTIALWVIVLLLVLLLLTALFNMFEGYKSRPARVPVAYSEFLKEVDQDRVRLVTIAGRYITAELRDGGKISSYAPDNPELLQRLSQHGVEFGGLPEEQQEGPHPLLQILVSWLPMLIFIAVLAYQGGALRRAVRTQLGEISQRLDRLAAVLEQNGRAGGPTPPPSATASEGPSQG